VASSYAQRIDNYLKKAWAPVVDLHLAFRPWDQNRTESEIIGILNSRKLSISELERIAVEAANIEDVDWRISLLQKTIDGNTHTLRRGLIGVSSELTLPAPMMINEAFNFSPIPPQFIFPRGQIQSLCALGPRLRDLIEGQNTESHQETLKCLESLREFPITLRRPGNLVERQLWRLLDLRDGDGFGFTIELFFLTLGRLSSCHTTSASSSELKVFYTGTLKVIISN
jgi:hypothetical protein